MLRWSMVLTLSLAAFALGSVADVPTADACPVATQARVHPKGKRGRPDARPSAPPTTPAGAFEGYNLERINAYRRSAGLADVTLDPTLTTFARAGSVELMNDHIPHQHFRGVGDSLWNQGFSNGASENQGSPTGWPRADADPTQNERRQIDQILASMMKEGPSGGHYRNMMSPKARRVGIGLVEDSEGKLYLTNDFSG